VYEYLEGRVVDCGAARLVLEVGGVGYALCVPVGADFGPTRADDRTPTRAWVHLVIREDAQTLYGFPRREERELFRSLLGVRGVGPGVALGLISGLSHSELLDAIASEEPKRLQVVRGVGRKTAEQIVLDLRDKLCVLEALLGTAPSKADREPGQALLNDAIAALVSLDFSEKEARRRVEQAAQLVEGEDLERLLVTALTS